MEMLNRMAAEAVRELDAIRHPSAKAKAKNLAKSLIGRGSANISDPIFWPAGLLLTGLMEAGHAGGPDLQSYSSSVEEYLAGWLQQGAPVRNPDDALTGTVILEMYARTENSAYKEAADKIAAYLKGCLRDVNGSIIYGQQSGNSWIYADGTGMTAMFLARYAKIVRSENHAEPDDAPGQSEDSSASSDHLPDETERNIGCTNDMGTAGATGNLRMETCRGASTSDKNTADAANSADSPGDTSSRNITPSDTDLSDADATGSPLEASGRYDPMADARLQLLNFARYGMDARSGLPYHAYDAENGLKLGIIGWGRAVGWLLLGLSEYLVCNPEDEELADFARTIITAVSDRIRPDGMLSWQLDCIEGPLDTSATGMIFYAMLRMNKALHVCPGQNEAPGMASSLPDASLPDTAAAASSPAKALHACPEQSGVPRTDSSLLDAAAAALRECVTDDGKVYWCSAECIDIARYSQQYGHYSWGQGAVLAFLSLYEASREIS